MSSPQTAKSSKKSKLGLLKKSRGRGREAGTCELGIWKAVHTWNLWAAEHRRLGGFSPPSRGCMSAPPALFSISYLRNIRVKLARLLLLRVLAILGPQYSRWKEEGAAFSYILVILKVRNGSLQVAVDLNLKRCWLEKRFSLWTSLCKFDSKFS